MSSGVKGAIRVSIPSSVKEMIINIKDITGQNHTEDEIYTVLKECSMDPNETLQKLLLLDTFHEVKRKRDRRKENLNKEPAELRWMPGTTQTRANKGSRGNYSSRYTSHDADGGKRSVAVKEIATDHLAMKGMSKAPLAIAPEMKKNETISITSPITDVSNGPSSITTQSTREIHASASGSVNQSEANENASMNKLEGPLPISSPLDCVRKARNPEIGDIHQQQNLSFINSTLMASPSAAGSFNSSDPLPFPSQDLPLPTAVASITSEVGSPHTHEVITDNNTEINSVSAGTSASCSGSTNLHQKITNELHVVGKNQRVVFLPIGSSTTGASSVSSTPSFKYNNRSQVIGPQKVGAGKEWKPKSTSFSSTGQVSATTVVSKVSISYPESLPIPVAIGSKEATLELQKKLEDSHLSDVQHVIMPSHLHVPETEKLWFRFGSFDVNFNLDKSQIGGPENDESQPLSESYEAINESMKQLPLSSQNAVTVVKDSEIKYPDEPQSPSQEPENFLSSEGEVPSSIIPDYSKSKQEVGPGSHQHPAVHTSSNYNFGFIPPVLSNQVSPLESSDTQARDVPRLPGFAQPLDPTSYYGQFYRSTVDSDGRISPFNPAVTTNKYAGCASIPVQTCQSPQELQGGVPFILSSSPTPLVTQTAGVMQSSVTSAQQPLHVFRQPTGIHMPHYPPNYIPYGPYFSPFYVPPQAILQFLSNGGFPQQPQANNIYPTPPGTAGKYSVSQYKQGSNTGSSTQIGMPGSFGPYDHSMANYTSSSSSAAVCSTSNEDFSASQIKENIYASGQQSESSGVWFTTPSRDISNLQASSFYNLPQGQLAFAPTQPGPGTFTSIFHHAQAVTAATVHPLLQQSQSITTPADIVGPTAHVYQQPQHIQLNWPTNY
ncbi:GBF-interacting protein 1-like isoform X4 [Primulina huaijiensis]|uniref:GBF-interacting protein 1-like isoform X4 n=1 Tax=Primulina huaijiensis TaxID=1492673 RepID=UPI003CC77590